MAEKQAMKSDAPKSIWKRDAIMVNGLPVVPPLEAYPLEVREQVAAARAAKESPKPAE
jgi:hypothetical protein